MKEGGAGATTVNFRTGGVSKEREYVEFGGDSVSVKSSGGVLFVARQMLCRAPFRGTKYAVG